MDKGGIKMTAITWIAEYIKNHADMSELIYLKSFILEKEKSFVKECPAEAMESAKKMYRTGNKLLAVKTVKDSTGWGLKESKDFCDIFFK